MIRHQAAMIVSFTSKSAQSGLHFLLWKSESKIKSSSKLRIDSLRRYDVQFCLQKKTQRICKMKSKQFCIMYSL